MHRAGPDGELASTPLPSDLKVVRYLQTAVDGHAFDLRIPSSLVLPDGVSSTADLNIEQLLVLASIEAFAGITIAEPHAQGTKLSWHAAFLFPPALRDHDSPHAVLTAILDNSHETGDVGICTPTVPSSRSKPVVRFLETAPDASYEEEWLLLEGFSKQGAHVAAMRPARSGETGACWLAILGNTFGFVRDLDRSDELLTDAVRNRPISDVLTDDSIALGTKQRLLDCEFSFGYFGQGGGVGGVVELSSLPWQKGVALANLIGDLGSGWEPVRPSDEGVLRAALKAVKDDHDKACQALRQAEADGQAALAQVLRARGATV